MYSIRFNTISGEGTTTFFTHDVVVRFFDENSRKSLSSINMKLERDCDVCPIFSNRLEECSLMGVSSDYNESKMKSTLIMHVAIPSHVDQANVMESLSNQFMEVVGF